MNDTSELLPCVQVDPPGDPRGAVIWLHGLGADGHDFEPIVPYLGVGAELGVRFVFPHAPAIPVTLNMGLTMPAWYDISEGDLRKRHDEQGILRSSRQVSALLDREIAAGIPSGRVVLAGFSQGGAIALHLGLRRPDRLAGILALSTYLVREETTESERSEANRSVPIFQAHGTLDPMVPPARGEAARDRLRDLGYDVAWSTYAMGHEVCPEEIGAIKAWLWERFSGEEG